MRYIKHKTLCPYEDYYIHQAGSGVGAIYKGTANQRGHGIGSFLGGLYRTILPLIKSGAKALGKEALTTGVGIFGDMIQAKPFEDSVRDRFKEATTKIKRKADEKIDNLMKGSGYKRKKNLRNHLNSSPTSTRKGRINKRSDIQDIFS